MENSQKVIFLPSRPWLAETVSVGLQAGGLVRAGGLFQHCLNELSRPPRLIIAGKRRQIWGMFKKVRSPVRRLGGARSSKAAGPLAHGAYTKVREYDKGPRTPLAAFFNISLMNFQLRPCPIIVTDRISDIRHPLHTRYRCQGGVHGRIFTNFPV